MAVTIGDLTITTLPADADKRLIAATGCTAAEHAAMLSQSGVSAVSIARALAPLADTATEDLTARIEIAGPRIVAGDVVALLKTAAPAGEVAA